MRKLHSLDNWVRFESKDRAGARQLRGRIRANWPFLVKGPAAVLEAQSAQPVGQLLQPYRTTRQQQGREGTEWPMSADSVVGPALLVNRIGEGTVLTFACSPDYATAGDHHIVEARRLLANAVHMLHPNPRVRVTAPANVEAVVTDDPAGRTLRVHLLGYNAPPQTTPAKNRPYVLPGLIEDAPMYRVALEFASPFRHASALGNSTDVRSSERRVEATVNDVYETIVVKY